MTTSRETLISIVTFTFLVAVGWLAVGSLSCVIWSGVLSRRAVIWIQIAWLASHVIALVVALQMMDKPRGRRGRVWRGMLVILALLGSVVFGYRPGWFHLQSFMVANEALIDEARSVAERSRLSVSESDYGGEFQRGGYIWCRDSKGVHIMFVINGDHELGGTGFVFSGDPRSTRFRRYTTASCLRVSDEWWVVSLDR